VKRAFGSPESIEASGGFLPNRHFTGAPQYFQCFTPRFTGTLQIRALA
jgi:hypothetical protein